MQTASLNFEVVNAQRIIMAPARNIELWVIGCGGTGSFLVQLLCRVVLALIAQGRNAKLVLVDPDHVEAKNVTRQCFCEAEVGMNKAQTLALRYSAAFGLPIEAIAEPFSPKMMRGGFYNTVRIFCGCVDNAAARQSIDETIGNLQKSLQRQTLESTWWIDGGNSQHHGQVLAGNYRSTDPDDYQMEQICKCLPLPSIQAPEMLEPRPEEQDPSLSGLSCAEIAIANAQSLVVNPQVATIMGQYVVDLLSNKLTKFATYFDLHTGTMTSQYNTKASIVAALPNHHHVMVEAKPSSNQG